jgi:hypothetical protein
MKGTRMLNISKNLRRRISMIASLGITGALLASAPMTANAAATTTVINFNASTTRADYPSLMAVGGGGGVKFAPWEDASGNNAPGVSGETNWLGRAGWTERNFAVQPDGGDNALWVQKGRGGCQDSGIQVATLANGRSFISASHTAVTASVWAADGGVDVRATLTDAFGGRAVSKTVTTGRANAYNTLTFDFGDATSGTLIPGYSYSRLSLVFDPANAKAGNGHDYWYQNCTDTGASVSKLYKVDDISFSSAAASAAVVGDKPHLLTYEDSDTLGNLAIGEPIGKWAGVFGGAGSGTSVPATAHTGKALEFNKGSSEAWAGINLLQAPGGENASGEVITSANYKTISFDYFSPAANSPVQLKLIASDGSDAIKVFVASAGWQTLSVDMSTIETWSSSKQYNQLVLYPGFADVLPQGVLNAGANGQLYYVDNVNINGYVGLTGTAKKGSRLTLAGNTWSGAPGSVSFKWYRCTVAGATEKATAPVTADKCTVISGATAATYTLGSSDKGKYVRGQITTTASGLTVIALSRTTGKVS